MSEHELRIQRSLQKINIPDWYRNNARHSSGGGGVNGVNGVNGVSGGLRRRDHHGSSSIRGGGWSAFNSQRDATTLSMTSLGSTLTRCPTPLRVRNVTGAPCEWRSSVKASRESLLHSPPSTDGNSSLKSISIELYDSLMAAFNHNRIL